MRQTASVIQLRRTTPVHEQCKRITLCIILLFDMTYFRLDSLEEFAERLFVIKYHRHVSLAEMQKCEHFYRVAVEVCNSHIHRGSQSDIPSFGSVAQSNRVAPLQLWGSERLHRS